MKSSTATPAPAASAAADAAAVGVGARQRQRELAEIVAAYTEVTDRLQLSHDRLRGEVARLREELAGKDRLLQRRSRLAALGEMAAGIAHEIRNPLGGIALYADLLAGKLGDREDLLSVARRIGAAVKGLDAIVSDVLTFAGEITPRLAPTSLGELLAATEAVVRARLAQRGSSLTVEADAALALRLDRTLMVRVLANLLSNAADAAGEGRVRLRAFARGADLVLEVADSGPGISPEAQERIFNPFYTTRPDGTGLGLAIVHRIVDSHDGTIAVENRPAPEGLGGAMFTVTLPGAVAAAPGFSRNEQETE